jgi:hypothetical protein
MADDVFHRLESSTQSSSTAKLQEASGEIWGREPYGSGFLVVQAYRKSLPAGERGIEFTTEVRPERGSGTPYEARWYYPQTPGTMLRQKDGRDFAAIPARVKNFQP